MSQTIQRSPHSILASHDFLRRVNALRRLDNLTNWFYLAREYCFLGSIAALTIAFYQYRGDWELAWAWNVPVTLVAIALMALASID